MNVQRRVPHHKLLLSARGNDNCNRRPADVGSGLPRAIHGNSQADGATPTTTSVCAAAKLPYLFKNGTKRPQSAWNLRPHAAPLETIARLHVSPPNRILPS